MKKKVFVINNRAFTLLEALMSLVVASLVVLGLMTFTTLLNFNISKEYEKDILMSLFQVQENLLEAKRIYVENSSLYIKDYNRRLIEIKEDNNRLVKTVDGKGYEILIPYIDTATFSTREGIIYANILINKKEYTGVVCYEK